jgi:hypothetical protein
MRIIKSLLYKRVGNVSQATTRNDVGSPGVHCCLSCYPVSKVVNKKPSFRTGLLQDSAFTLCHEAGYLKVLIMRCLGDWADLPSCDWENTVVIR